MTSIEEVVADYEAQIVRAQDRIRMFGSGEMSVGDAFTPFKDSTPEAIAIERQIISSLESAIKILRGL